MPEGDTIFRAATRLRPILEGQVIQRAESREVPAVATLVGHQVKAVEPRGKHLLFHFDDGRALHSHMGMTGSWHLYKLHEPWQKPAHRASILLETTLHTVVCFSPKTLELLSEARLRRHEYLQKLGPDLLGAPLENEEVLRRFRVHNGAPLGEVILNQTVISGAGNVYKSEMLFLLHLHPQTQVWQLSDEELLTLTMKTREWMQKNLDGNPRTTRRSLDGRRFWTYGRSGQPCFVCGTKIEMIRQGDLGRSTYFCPNCQPVR